MNTSERIKNALGFADERRSWQLPDPNDDISAATAELGNLMAARHQREDAKHLGAKPLDTAEVSEHESWKDRGRRLAIDHETESTDFSRRADAIVSQLRVAGDLVARYNDAYTDLEAALERAAAQADEAIVPIAAERARLEEMQESIKSAHDNVVRILREMGANTELLDDRFTGWELQVRRALFNNFCQARNIDPNNRPVPTEKPERPVPEELESKKKATAPQKRFSVPNILMGIGGLVLGLSLAAAARAMFCDSDGFHFVWILFLILQGVSVTLAVEIGNRVFTMLMRVIHIDSIDVYYYYAKSQKEIDDWRDKAAKSAKLAKLGIVGIFIVFAGIDAFGWSRLMIERNYIVAGVEGQHAINPFAASLFMMFLTCLFAVIKLSSIKSDLDPIREAIELEVRKNAIAWKDRETEYDEKVTNWKAELKAIEAYDAIQVQGKQNEDYMFREKRGAIADAISAYLALFDQAQPAMIDQLDQEEAMAITVAAETVRPQLIAVADAERALDELVQSSTKITTDLEAAREASLRPVIAEVPVIGSIFQPGELEQIESKFSGSGRASAGEEPAPEV